MKDRVNCLNCGYTDLTEVGDRIEVAFQLDLGLIMLIGDAQYTIRTLEAGRDIILIAEVIMVIMHEVIRGM